MQVYKGIKELASPLKRVVATIGNFDGVHLGHRELLNMVCGHALRIGGTPVVITFRPHPFHVLRPKDAPLLLNTYEEKLKLISQLGVSVILEEPFSREFSNTSPEQFLSEYLRGKLGAEVLYLGYDFAFGKERAGTVEMLQKNAQNLGMEAHVVPPYQVRGTTVSSSSIRKLLDNGDIPFVNECLGRKFFLQGIVWRGEGRGRKIGIPTANIQTEARKYPRVGVYATRTHWRGEWYPSISNIGYNPTFKGEGDDLPLKVETHLFDFNRDMYGDSIEVEFLAFLRDEKKFASVDELLVQILADSAQARKILQ